MANDWYEIKFLESATNVRKLIARTTGRTLSASMAREIAVCVQQGRLYFEAATLAPIQIKPLLLYYGVVAFAQAVVVGRTHASLATLKRGHGLTDITPAGSGLEGLVLRVEGRGTFQEFNDAVAPLGRICYFDDNAMPRWFQKPFDKADGLQAKDISILDILSRLPELAKTYALTFECSAHSVPLMLGFEQHGGLCTLRIDDPALFSDKKGLVASVNSWRTAYPFLKLWRFREASFAWGNAILIFDNAVCKDDDLAETSIVQSQSGFSRAPAKAESPYQFAAVADLLPPLSGGIVRSSSVSAMQPVSEVSLSEYALYFLGNFLLSSLVRYRPLVWQNSIARSVSTDRPADDRSLSLIEKFLDDTLAAMPDLVARSFDYK